MLEVSNRLSSAATGGDSGTAVEALPPTAAGVVSRLLHRRLTPAPIHARMAYNCQRPAASGQRPAASGQRPAASGQRPAAMTCARRPAGARKPAPSAGSPSRPDPRPGRRRARLPSLLLPALALLLGALVLFPAAPAQAQAPGAPTGLNVWPRDAGLGLTWKAGSGTPTGYDVHYTSSTTVANTAAVGTSVATAWVASSRTSAGTRRSQEISSLTNGTTYRVRVRATNDDGNSTWIFGSGQAGLPAGTSWSATLSVGTGASLGCIWRGQCDSRLSDNAFTVGGTEFHFTKIAASITGSLEVWVIPRATAALRALQFCSGPYALRMGGTHNVGTTSRVILNGNMALGWAANSQVEIRVGSDCATGQAPAPTAPTSLTIESASQGGRLSLQWTHPSHGGRLTGVEVDWKERSAPDHDTVDPTNSNPSHGWVRRQSAVTNSASIFGLKNGQTYDVAVRFVNAVGKGEWIRRQRMPVTPVSLSVDSGTIEEGNSAVVTATLATPWNGDSDFIIPVVASNGTAEEIGDFSRDCNCVPGDWFIEVPNIMIRRGATTGSVKVKAWPDKVTESAETMTVALDTSSLPDGVRAGGTTSVTITITDPQGGSGTERPTVTLTRELYALIQQIEGWRDDPALSGHRPHVARWNRVLLAFGWEVKPASDGSLEPMSAAEAQGYADRGWTRWVAVAAALRDIEGPPPPEPDPVVTIAGGAAVTEGAAASFTLTSAPAPSADLAVEVWVTQSGAYAQASVLGTRTVTIPSGTTTASFTVATVDDNTDEADGGIVATLAAGTGYTVGDAARASVKVADNDEDNPDIVTKKSIAREGTDAAAVFTVRLSRAASHAVTVDYATADGAGSWAGTAPARSGADYTATSGTLTFAAGETRKTVTVPILDDAIDEGTEYFLLRFSRPDGAKLESRYRETQGLIRNSDPLQAMWLARFGRMVASDAVASVTARLETPRDAGSHVTVAGQRMNFGEAEGGEALATVLTGFAQTFGAPSAPAVDKDDPFARHGLTSRWNDPATAAVSGARRVTARELLLGTSFRAVLGQGAGSQWTSWGQGASVSRFSAAVPGLGLTGEAATGSMGMDYERGRLLMGFAMTHSVGEGSASDAGWRYALGSTATMAMPYARLALSDRISVWGLAGTGSGRLSLDLDGAVPQSYRTDLSMTLAATGVRGDLVTPAEPGGFALALKADAFWVRTESDRVTASAFGSLMGARGESSRVRAMLDGSRTFSFASGAALTPKLELGVRHDAGDAETGTGVEVGAGLGYADPSRGLDMALKVHGLAVHAEDGYDEWGVSGQLRLVPGGAGRGLSMSLTPSYGVDPAGTQRLWALPASSGLAANGEAEPSSRFDAEVGYGMALLGDRFTGTPNVGFGLSEAAREYRMGWRLTSAVPGDPGFEVSLDATRREAANDDGPPEHGVMLRSLIKW